SRYCSPPIQVDRAEMTVASRSRKLTTADSEKRVDSAEVGELLIPCSPSVTFCLQRTSFGRVKLIRTIEFYAVNIIFHFFLTNVRFNAHHTRSASLRATT